ncbi:transcription factor IIA, alpha/beta subunit [Laetiporus sulphureus 93-53]|uniref:Transcription factor IIA, alpha/beta subunit n=1 Tax=Laetiporus sulphureus 93-53 TaxID=1314785 RepID=A0A165GVT5_9APHY|nr:transcription factor IIA, alpha/beta subunit [Laetiporus sulphureus 93-53]KZT10891.1 transcription factor IIA, alpha/beta subunit [Laetiporus sulphureus 93-53]
MSNKLVPNVYRQVIDDVMKNIQPEFEEYGVSEDILAELQHKWESKVIASHVAEFEPSPALPPQAAAAAHPTHPSYPPHPMHAHMHGLPTPHYPPHNPYGQTHTHAHQGPQVKSEPVENRYMLNGQGMTAYGMPPLPGPQIPGARQPTNMTYASHPAPPTARYPPPGPAPQHSAPQARIPQVDGPSSSSSDSPSPPPSQAYAPRSSHPSLPQPVQTAPRTEDDEAINSDLDDTDTDNDDDGEEGGAADTDIVFCTYDKVARVKNKWKCILKDGMIHINGKDYLFAKCTGEFEW